MGKKFMKRHEDRLDKYHNEILKHVNEHPGQTENQIATSLFERKICSKVTTLKKIDELKEIGEIDDLLKEGESGFHKLYIVDESEFNRINNELTEIESIIDSKKRKDNEDFEKSFLIQFNMMIYGYLVRINKNVKSYDDSQKLYNKIIKLVVKMCNRSNKILSGDTVLDHNIIPVKYMESYRTLVD